MADGRISIDVDVDGKSIGPLNGQLDQLEGKSNKASGGVKQLALSIGLVKIASAAFDVLKGSLDAAISRFDTMQKYPKVMGALGFSAEESQKSVAKLSDGIDGLPTKLDDVVATAQRMTTVSGNLDKSTKATIALNNAMLASGASTDDAKRGVDQYIKMLSTGKVELTSWQTLQETMPIGLQKTAEAMGFLGKTAQNDLYNALKEGTISFDQFQNKLIELGTGTGELAKLAKLNSEGIATSFSNLKNAASKGIANIIEALNDLSKEVSGKSIAQNLDSLKVMVNATFKAITDVIRASAPVVSLFIKALSSTLDVAKPLTPVLLGLVAAYGAFKVLSSINSLMQGTNAILHMAAWSGEALTLVTKGHMVAQLADTNATKADILAKSAQQGAVKLSTLLIGFLTGEIHATTFATTLATAATTAFNSAITFLSGPIGWLVLAIGALVTAAVALWKWFNKEEEAVKAVREEQENLIKSTDDLVKKNEESVQSRKEEVESLNASKENYTALIKEMDMLASKEKLSTAEKKRMGEIVEQLNTKLGNLNLVYDEQNNKLGEQPAKIQQQIDAFNALDEAASAQERINEMLKQRNDNEAKLMEINIARERWNETLQKSSGNTKEARENIEELSLQEQALMETQRALTGEILSTANIHEEAMQRASVATENSVLEQSISYNALQGKNKEVMDALRAEYTSLEEKVGNVFDSITQKQAISADQMIVNLQKNQEAVAQWSANLSELSRRGVEEGLIEQLRKMGPEGANQAAELVNSSDEKLQELNEVFRRTPETALQGMKEAYQLGKNGVNDEVASIIPTQKETLTTQLAQANFSEVGKSVTDDVKAGIENGRAAVAESTKGIVANSEQQAKSEVEKGDFKGIGLSIPQGMEKGIAEGKEKPKQAVTSLTEDVISGARLSLDTHSPSKVFHEIGQNVTQGLTNGIDALSDTPTRAIRQVTEMLINSMNDLPTQMENMGRYAMDGLTNGIYAGSSNALSAARSVANSITDAIQTALDIHSPSRVMRDKVGKYIPQGIAMGIEKDADVAINAIDKLSGLLSSKISPEAVLDIPNFSGSNYTEVLKNIDSSTVNSPTININIDKANLSNDRGIEDTSKQLAILTEKQLRGRLQ